jgi:splicing factor 3B subunit 2
MAAAAGSLPPALDNKLVAQSENDTKKKKKKKKKKRNRIENGTATNGAGSNTEMSEGEPQVEIEYVAEAPVLPEDDPVYAEFAEVIKKFQAPPVPTEPTKGTENGEEGASTDQARTEKAEEPSEANSETAGENLSPKPTKKERKVLKRMRVAYLKQLVSRPDLVEIHDGNSPDPFLLIHLKSYRNTVPVPRHWCQKRRYLQGKRGIEKPPFKLPEFIAATGIAKLRAAYLEKEEAKKQKQKARERMQPKMHRMDIDYQVLHDAFFKYQTKPKLTVIGDIYYEGKEFEVNLRTRKPGELSEELKKALGMPPGAPPPWLINMQRYGPPPSYPHLKIPGLNAPIPPGAQWGYHPGGWGKPPVDEQGHPLYGDVFGTAQPALPPEAQAPVQRTHWGELVPEEEAEEAVEESAEEPGAGEEGAAGGEVEESGLVTESGAISTPAGLETPEVMELRKRKEAEAAATTAAAAAAAADRPLYQVLEQEQTSVAGALYGSAHKYIIPGEKTARDKSKVDLLKSQKTEKIAVTIDPTELEQAEELNEELIKKKYAKALQEKADTHKTEDVSDVLAEQEKKKRRKEQKSEQKAKKPKEKEFKF